MTRQIYASTDTDLLKSEAFQAALSKAVNIYDFKRSKVLLSHLGIDLPTANFDARLAKYLLSTVEDNELSTIARLYTDLPLETDEVVYGKGAKRAVPEKDVLLSHLAKKVKVLQVAKPVMLEKLAEHGQSELLFDMELPLANVLAKMEIAGIKVKDKPLTRWQWKTK